MIREILQQHTASECRSVFALRTSSEQAELSHIKPRDTYVDRFHDRRFSIDFPGITGSSFVDTSADITFWHSNLNSSAAYCRYFDNIRSILGKVNVFVCEDTESYSGSVGDSVTAIIQKTAASSVALDQFVRESNPCRLLPAIRRISTFDIPSFVKILLFKVRMNSVNCDTERAVDEMYDGIYQLIVGENFKHIDVVLDYCDVHNDNISVCLSLLTITKGVASKLARRVHFYERLSQYLFVHRSVDQAKRLLYGLQ